MIQTAELTLIAFASAFLLFGEWWMAAALLGAVAVSRIFRVAMPKEAHEMRLPTITFLVVLLTASVWSVLAPAQAPLPTEVRGGSETDNSSERSSVNPRPTNNGPHPDAASYCWTIESILTEGSNFACAEWDPQAATNDVTRLRIPWNRESGLRCLERHLPSTISGYMQWGRLRGTDRWSMRWEVGFRPLGVGVGERLSIMLEQSDEEEGVYIGYAEPLYLEWYDLAEAVDCMGAIELLGFDPYRIPIAFAFDSWERPNGSMYTQWPWRWPGKLPAPRFR